MTEPRFVHLLVALAALSLADLPVSAERPEPIAARLEVAKVNSPKQSSGCAPPAPLDVIRCSSVSLRGAEQVTQQQREPDHATPGRGTRQR